VYGCPQSPFKFHPDFDEVLAGVLRGDPAGVALVIDAKYPQWRRLLEERWSRTMPDVAGRIRFAPRLPRSDFLELLAACDVVLDPFPFGGGHTSYESLSLGLPVVTLPSALLRGRLTYAMYRQMGYDGLIAGDPMGYIRLALELGGNPERRAAASRAILESCDCLFDDLAAVRLLEDFWEREVR
jgi:protein O-GlcNAc transferase